MALERSKLQEERSQIRKKKMKVLAAAAALQEELEGGDASQHPFFAEALDDCAEDERQAFHDELERLREKQERPSFVHRWDEFSGEEALFQGDDETIVRQKVEEALRGAGVALPEADAV